MVVFKYHELLAATTAQLSFDLNLIKTSKQVKNIFEIFSLGMHLYARTEFGKEKSLSVVRNINELRNDLLLRGIVYLKLKRAGNDCSLLKYLVSRYVLTNTNFLTDWIFDKNGGKIFDV